MTQEEEFRKWALGFGGATNWYWDRTKHHSQMHKSTKEYTKQLDIPKEVMPFPQRLMFCMMIANLELSENCSGVLPYPNASLIDIGTGASNGLPCEDDYYKGECWVWNKFIWLWEHFNAEHPCGDGYYRATAKEVEHWLVASWTLHPRAPYFEKGKNPDEHKDTWPREDAWRKAFGPFEQKWRYFYGLTERDYPKLVKRTAKLVARLWASLARLNNPRVLKQYGGVARVIEPDEQTLQEQVLDALELRDVSERAILVFRQYCEGKNQDQIAESLAVTQSTIAVDIRSVREQIGFAFEDAISARYTTDNVPHERGGENTPEPDIIILDADGNPKEIHSLKCYITARNRSGTTVPREKIGKSERALSLTGIPLYLIFFDVVADELHPKVLVENQLTFTFKRGVVV